jgi:5-methylcytosine-specific restriction protein A
MFDPKLEIGKIIDNPKLMEIFKCGQQGGMRRSKRTNTLVLISDYTKGIYHDKWIGDTLHYTGMGLSGDQDIDYMQNRTLNESNENNVDIHLFEVLDPKEYMYCGRVKLVGTPYTEMQIDRDGNKRTVWIFPIQPMHTHKVKKPTKYYYQNIEEYKAHYRGDV